MKQQREVLTLLADTFGDHQEPKEKAEALRVLGQFTEVFKLPGESTERMDWVTHTIDIGQAAPIRQRLRKVPIQWGH